MSAGDTRNAAWNRPDLQGWGEPIKAAWKSIEGLSVNDPRARKGIELLVGALRKAADDLEATFSG